MSAVFSWQNAKDHLAIASITGFVALANYQLHEINKALVSLAEKTAVQEAIAAAELKDTTRRLDGHRDALLVLQRSDAQQQVELGILEVLAKVKIK